MKFVSLDELFFSFSGISLRARAHVFHLRSMSLVMKTSKVSCPKSKIANKEGDY